MKLNRFAQDLLKGRWVEIMRAGAWNRTTFTVDDLKKIAEDYDSHFRVAPLVIGHPSLLEVEGERAAHGVIADLRVVADSLQARIENLSDEVRAGLQSGKWISRSIEAMKFGKGENRSWYLTGLALLGGSQPAVDAMLSDDSEKCCIDCDAPESKSPEIEKHESTPTNSKGASQMDEAQVNALIEAATKPLKTEIAELRGRPNVSLEEFQKMQEKVATVDELKASNDKLVAELAADKTTSAQKECDLLFAGPTKALFDDKYKASCLAALSTGNRELFDVLAAPVIKAKGKFSYLFTEQVTEEGTEQSEEIAGLEFTKGKDATESKRSKRMMEILAKAKKDGIELSEDDALIQAYREVKD